MIHHETDSTVNSRPPEQRNGPCLIDAEARLCAANPARRMFFFLLFVCFAFAGSRANAQMATAQISGTVHDQTGAVVPGAQVTATHSATGIATAAITNDQGFFVLPSLAVGSYSINATATGFEKYRQTGIGLTVGQQLNLRIGLKVGKADEVVTVTADAVAVDSSSPTEQSTVEEKVIQDLPLNGRNPAALTYTVAGVVVGHEKALFSGHLPV